MSQPPHSQRTAAEILADLRTLNRENDRLELRIGMIRQSIKAAEARLDDPATTQHYLDRAQQQLRHAG